MKTFKTNQILDLDLKEHKINFLVKNSLRMIHISYIGISHVLQQTIYGIYKKLYFQL